MDEPAQTIWSLLDDSELIEASERRRLRDEFEQSRQRSRGVTSTQSENSDERMAAEWLVRRKALTSYQAAVLLKGQLASLTVGDYVLQDRLSPGIHSRRFRARHRPTGHPVILHVLLADALYQARDLAPWLARHRRLRHPNLDRIYDVLPVSATTPRLSLVSELPGGVAADQIVNARGGHRTTGTLAPRQACRIVYHTAIALDYLHASGMVHGHIAPAYIVVQDSDHVVLLRGPLWLPERTDTVPIKVRPWRGPYWAPELFLDPSASDVSSDVYALGCTLYELVAGRPPFQAEDWDGWAKLHTSQSPKPIRPLTGVSEELAAVVEFAMAKDRRLRYKSAAEFAERLEPLMAASSAPPQRRVRPTEPFFLQQNPARGQVLPDHLADGESPLAVADSPPEKPPVVHAQSAVPSASSPTVARPSAAEAIREIHPEARTERWRGRSRRRDIPPWLIATLVLLLILSGGLVAYRLATTTAPIAAEAVASRRVGGLVGRPTGPSSEESERTGPRNGTPAPTSHPTPGMSTEATLIADDGHTLWQSPTSGPPLKLDYLPPDVQMIVAIRPRDLASTLAGRRLLDAWHDDLQSVRETVEAATGRNWQDVDQIIVGMAPRDALPPATVWIIRAAPSVADSSVTNGQDRSVQRAPPEPAVPVTSPSEMIERRGGLAIFHPPQPGTGEEVGDQHETVVASDADTLELILASPQVDHRRELRTLARSTDQNRHLQVLMIPEFLAADGRRVLLSYRQPVVPWLQALCGRAVSGVTISLHVGPIFYGELQLLSTSDYNPYLLAERIRETMGRWPAQVSQLLGRVAIDPRWQSLAVRLPSMVRVLVEQARSGVVGDLATINWVLPAEGAHNLALAVDLLMASMAMPRRDITARPGDEREKPENIDWPRLLSSRLDFEVVQQSLEFSVQDLTTIVGERFPAIDFDVRIDGAALQEEGITRNQQIRNFRQPNRTLSDILTALVQRANPVPTDRVSAPEQKLIWAYEPRLAEEGPFRVHLTTRKGATSAGWTIPPVFLANARDNGLE